MSAILKAIMKEELSHHCRRRTRGGEVTLQLGEEFLIQRFELFWLYSPHNVLLRYQNARQERVIKRSSESKSRHSHRDSHQGSARRRRSGARGTAVTINGMCSPGAL